MNGRVFPDLRFTKAGNRNGLLPDSFLLPTLLLMEREESILRLEDLAPEQLADFIRQLIDTDFTRLVQLLYRLDVSEQKIRSVLLENPGGDAGAMIAQLILERIEQREKNKQLFKPNSDIPEEERW